MLGSSAPVSVWAESSHRHVRYPVCDDRRALIWLANQRAVEYHSALGSADDIYRPTHLVLDLDHRQPVVLGEIEIGGCAPLLDPPGRFWLHPRGPLPAVASSK